MMILRLPAQQRPVVVERPQSSISLGEALPFPGSRCSQSEWMSKHTIIDDQGGVIEVLKCRNGLVGWSASSTVLLPRTVRAGSTTTVRTSCATSPYRLASAKRHTLSYVPGKLAPFDSRRTPLCPSPRVRSPLSVLTVLGRKRFCLPAISHCLAKLSSSFVLSVIPLHWRDDWPVVMKSSEPAWNNFLASTIDVSRPRHSLSLHPGK